MSDSQHDQTIVNRHSNAMQASMSGLTKQRFKRDRLFIHDSTHHALTAIFFAWASLVLGILIVNTPSLYFAST